MVSNFHTRTAGAVSIQCDERLKVFALQMLSEAESMDKRKIAFRDGMAILHGWSPYKFKGKPGAWHIEEPDFGSDPYSHSRQDCTFTLSLLAQQFALGERLGLKPSQLNDVSCFEMILHPNCLHDLNIRAERVSPRADRFSGWQLSSLDRATCKADDMVTDDATLTKARPARLRVILLPVGYVVKLRSNEISKVFDPQKNLVYTAK